METDSIPLLASLGGEIFFYPFTINVIVGIIVLVFLLICSALVSGSEVAFFSLSPSNKEKIKEGKHKSHHILRDLLNLPENLLATILVSNNFINVGIVILSTYLINNSIDFSNAQIWGFVIEVVVITSLLLLFGEILPKIYASYTPLRFAEIMARPLLVASKIFSPVTKILTRSTSFINKRMAKHTSNPSIDELSEALKLTSDDELSEDKEILEGIIKFGSTSVDQIMTPRIDVTAIDTNTSFDRILTIINDLGYSRMPVYNETFDNIEGVLYIKDLLPFLDQTSDFNWHPLIRPPYYVPENKKIDDLLEEFQKAKVHMAVVVDEYGGTSGIVTLEDVLEEIVGDIVDEFDDDDSLHAKVNDNTFIFDGKIQLNDFFRISMLDDHYFDSIKGEADTLAGLLLEMKGDFPAVNEKLSYKNVDFFVESIDKRRIKKIKVVFNNPPE